MSIFKKHIDAMSAYNPPLEGRDPEEYTLLDFNERTVEVPEFVREALKAFVDSGRLHMYPSYGDLVERIAGYCGARPEQVMITNGSDHGIDLVIRSACREGDEIIIPVPTFAMYAQCAGVENLHMIQPCYNRDTGYPVAEVIAAITDKTRAIVISNPNNPCGTLVQPEDVVAIAKAAPEAVILVDECYFEYSRVSVVDRIDECANIVITRTFSKTWGLPSIRLGYVISVADNIRALLNVRGPYDINQFAVAAAMAVLDVPQLSLSYVDEVMSVSKPMLESFFRGCNVDFWPSSANYLWVFPDRVDYVERVLKDNSILVRPKMDADGRMGLRITVGTRGQTLRLIAVLEEVVAAK